MATPVNHWKLGLFVVVGVVALLATIAVLGANTMQNEMVTYTTYFDESVQGLDLGSPVKFRGVTIGNVSAIGLAPDKRHVEVSCDLSVRELDALGLNKAAAAKTGRFGFALKKRRAATIALPPDLRTQLASSGITGVKFILIDFFDVKGEKPVAPPFPLPENYIPSTPSTLKNLEDAVVKAVDRLPEVVDALVAILAQASRMLTSVDQQEIPRRVSETLTKADRLVVGLQRAVAGAHVEKLSGGAETAIAGLNVAVTRLNAILAKVDGEKGLLVSTQRASDSVGDVAGGARGLGVELAETLRGVREAMASVQRLTEALETDSDMLLKGRAVPARGGKK